MGPSLVAGAIMSETVISGIAVLTAPAAPSLMALLAHCSGFWKTPRQLTRYPDRQIIENTRAYKTSTPV